MDELHAGMYCCIPLQCEPASLAQADMRAKHARV